MPGLRSFGRNRLLRIAPAYWVILLLAGLVFGAAVIPHPTSVVATGSLARHPGTLLADLFLVQGYHPKTLLTGIGPAWTLTVEVGFYVTLPIVCALVYRLSARTRSRAKLVFLPPFAFLTVGLCGKLFAVHALGGADGWSHSWPSVLARSFVANADLFAAGMCVAAVAVLVEAGALRLPAWWRPAAWMSAGLVAIAAGFVPGGEFTIYRYDVLVALATALAVSTLVIHPRIESRLMRFLESRALVASGLVSYSVYLWHQPVIDWMRARSVLPLDGAAGLVVAVGPVGAITAVLSTVTYRFVERPALERKRSDPRARAGDQTCTLTLLEQMPAPSQTE
jgi:peptidoglycan/LPS O-acetylase OafA/YrhL